MALAIVTVCLHDVVPGELEQMLTLVLAPYDIANDSDGKWDSWVVNGGDAERGIRVKPGYDEDFRLVRSPRYGNGQPRGRWPLRCDGGPRCLLDFEYDRRREAERAESTWDAWNAVASRHPPAEPMNGFLERHRANPIEYPQALAWRDYVDQPVIRAFKKLEGAPPTRAVWDRFNDPVEQFGFDRTFYIHRQAARVMPTDALLQADGAWVDDEAFGGPFDDSRWDRYYQYADGYLDALGGETFIVRLRFHS